MATAREFQSRLLGLASLWRWRWLSQGLEILRRVPADFSDPEIEILLARLADGFRDDIIRGELNELIEDYRGQLQRRRGEELDPATLRRISHASERLFTAVTRLSQASIQVPDRHGRRIDQQHAFDEVVNASIAWEDETNEALQVDIMERPEFIRRRLEDNQSPFGDRKVWEITLATLITRQEINRMAVDYFFRFKERLRRLRARPPAPEVGVVPGVREEEELVQLRREPTAAAEVGPTTAAQEAAEKVNALLQARVGRDPFAKVVRAPAGELRAALTARAMLVGQLDELRGAQVRGLGRGVV